MSAPRRVNDGAKSRGLIFPHWVKSLSAFAELGLDRVWQVIRSIQDTSLEALIGVVDLVLNTQLGKHLEDILFM